MYCVLEGCDPAQEFFGLEVVVPAGADDDRVRTEDQSKRRIVPDCGFGLESALGEGLAADGHRR